MAETIRTTHVGSLPRPTALIEENIALQKGELDRGEFDQRLQSHINDVVAQQLEAGIDLVNDGEYGKPMVEEIEPTAWVYYAWHRFDGLGFAEHRNGVMPNPNEVPGKYDEPELTTYANRRDYSAFKDAYLSDPYNAGIMAALDNPTAPAIVKEVTYIGQDAVRADAEGLRSALAAAGAEGRGFISSISPGMLSSMGNAHYESRHDAGMALAAELNKEYRAIVDAGHTLQIDAPDLADSWDQMNPAPSVEEYLKYVRHSVEEINESIKGIDRDKVRIHICWGSWHGPHTTDIPFDDIVDTVFEANAGAFSFEAANPRHAWEWKIWKNRTLPKGVKLIPGVISHNTNIVEHPETVAQSIIRFAELVGPENVIASTDCGLGGRLHSQLAWAKLRALGEGAQLAEKYMGL